jgi:hypothetical protein
VARKQKEVPTTQIKVLSEKLTVANLVKKFPVFTLKKATAMFVET